MAETLHRIAGQDISGAGGGIAVVNPANAVVIGEFREATGDQVAQAVRAAGESFDSRVWVDTPFAERRAVLRRAAQAIRGNADRLTDLQVAEGGMTRRGVAMQVQGAANWFDYFADFLTLEGGEVYRQLGDATALVEREPIGVCALFSPWNVPVGLSAIKLAPALASGNSIVLKPSEQTPMTLRLLVDLVESAGLPKGVLNCVNGRGQTTGGALAVHPGVDMISYTGGHVGGRAVAEAAARRHIPCVTELGGKSATLIFDDADIDAAVEGALRMVYGSNGEACLAGSRIVIQDTVAGDVMTRFRERAEGLAIGDPMADGTYLGPMVSADHQARVLGFYESAAVDGDEVLFGGAHDGDGFFVRPGAIRVASFQSRIWREEVFGPLAAIAVFRDEAEAIDIANDSEFGLSGYVWTRDIDRALHVARRVRTGTVIVNGGFMRELNAPFGGYRNSGVGREGGAYSWRNFTEAKTTVINHR